MFAQNIDCGYALELPHSKVVLTRNRNPCLRAKIRKIVYTTVNRSFTIKSGVCGGINYMDVLA